MLDPFVAEKINRTAEMIVAKLSECYQQMQVAPRMPGTEAQRKERMALVRVIAELICS